MKDKVQGSEKKKKSNRILPAPVVPVVPGPVVPPPGTMPGVPMGVGKGGEGVAPGVE